MEPSFDNSQAEDKLIRAISQALADYFDEGVNFCVVNQAVSMVMCCGPLKGRDKKALFNRQFETVHLKPGEPPRVVKGLDI